ncbi:hypothetical protein LTS07_011174 [Exophiala sideris]|uniref:Uncharacterized protein n=1 Tax=Exophiala sideris TaxID=1016849 RepID=A0ABR0IVM8_9EURO|nr:hypothetical protein LTS07_011174 [Exophiala sideris]KAK5023795.1 hypothetical protein LTR13_011104 [Exophiala sideris]KAK5048874.1 hypothetical protein LTR69_011219 [Exophiala sideris]KAK5176336.1 hypothetical protein LTR44_011098 [Eurotiomycetes sp. CCFEE 6388]
MDANAETPSRTASSRSPSPSPNLLPASETSSLRSCSGISFTSDISSSSSVSSASRTTGSSRRRGYVRPTGGTFSDSAIKRESVMSLGTIAHLQYYFSRTGLLDGKGGQLTKKKQNGEYNIPRSSLAANQEVVESPIDDEGQAMWEAAQEHGPDVMLPPTVSTYSLRPNTVAPPPDQKAMKKELVEALENALQAVESCERSSNEDPEEQTQGFYEIQGLHVLDTATQAIRAARLYYTLHPDPQKLNSIKSDQELRRDLHSVLDVLKRCASRSFAGGFREDERLAVLIWVSDVGMMIDQEAKMEEAEKNERRDWHWMDDSKWVNRDKERDINFLDFLLAGHCRRPSEQTLDNSRLFFRNLGDGRDLVRMHNAAVQRSKKHFDYIKSFHEDVAKPYRRADNIRYWLKAAELRWELRLKLDVMALANAVDDDTIWSAFEDVVRQWSRGVRAELSKDWNGDEERRLHARARSLAQASPLSSPTRRSPPVSALNSPSKRMHVASPLGSPSKRFTAASLPESPIRKTAVASCEEEG